MKQSYLPNFSYLFIPFAIDKLDDFPAFLQKITPQNGWLPMQQDNRYLHRYVAERISNSQQAVDCQFRLDAKFAEAKGLCLGTKQYRTAPKSYHGEKNDGFVFDIASVELHSFHTGVCVLAFELRFADNDPLKIAAAQYCLRKISTEKIYLAGEDAGGESFVDISKRILQDCTQNATLDFLFYATPKNEKANFLTYVDVPEQKSYDKELFYLKWCYNENFEYSDPCCEEDSINYAASPFIHWGISVSAAVCLVHRSERQKQFIETVFQTNFRQQYLRTYILLLHQKYMMYLFLTKLSVDLDGNLQQLKAYKERLYRFETHYMFTYISEVPQYQRFYKKVREVFALEQLFKEVQEPLVQLAEIQKQEAESEQQAQERRINAALTTVSLLTIFSAWTDASGLVTYFDWLIPETISRVAQSALTVVVIALSIGLVIRLFCVKKR